MIHFIGKSDGSTLKILFVIKYIFVFVIRLWSIVIGGDDEKVSNIYIYGIEQRK